MSAPNVLLAAGRIVGGKYAVKASLGMAGTGRVGRHHAITEPNQEVLLEVIACPEHGRHAFASEMEETRRRLADVPTRLVVPWSEHGVEESGLGYVVAPWPSVPPLGELVAVCTLLPAELVDLARALAASLGAAHAVGVLHLGLDASSVHVPPLTKGAVIVSGFGLVRAAAAAGVDGWQEGGAPELARGIAEATAAADVFGVARVLQHAATAGAATLEECLPAPMAETIRRALDADPRARFEDVAALAETLAAALAGKRPPPRTIPVPSSASLVAAAVVAPVEPPPPMAVSTSPFEVGSPRVSSSGEIAIVPPRRSAVPWVAGGVAVVLALVTGVVVVAKRPRPGPVAQEVLASRPAPSASAVATPIATAAVAVASPPDPPPIAREAEKPLGTNEAELTIACTPACETILVNGKALDTGVAPARLPAGTYGIGVSAPGYGGQWKKVVLKAGARQTVPFTMTPAVKAPAARPKNCGKFLKRCD